MDKTNRIITHISLGTDQLQCRQIVLGNFKKLMKLRDFEHLIDILADRAQHQSTIPLGDPLVQTDELAECRTGKIFDRGKVEDHPIATLLLDQLGQLVTDPLNDRFIQQSLDQNGHHNEVPVKDTPQIVFFVVGHRHHFPFVHNGCGQIPVQTSHTGKLESI